MQNLLQIEISIEIHDILNLNYSFIRFLKIVKTLQFLKYRSFQKLHFQCFCRFQQMTCGANCGANEKSSYKKVIKNLLVTA
jgi:hypothetical protein